MTEFTFLPPLLLTIGGLIIGALLKSLLRHTRIPYTVGLFAVGLLLGLINRYGFFDFLPSLSDAVRSVADINPDLILYLFLPILIFDAAYELNLHIFRKTLANATLLAVPGLVICMFLTAALLMGIGTVFPAYSSWTWTCALMFGALISATDPVAVVALLHELKTSKRFSTLVDAESLLNDGTGIVCFMLFFGALTSPEYHNTSPLLEFIKVISLSSVIGFIMARLVIWFITRVNSQEMIQNSVIILSAYATFIHAQYYLGVSGVIALVVFGLTITYTGKPRFKPQVNKFMEQFWELLTYIANTLIFIIVGIVIAEKVNVTWKTIGILMLLYLGLNLIRFVMIMLLYPVLKRIGYGLTRRESVILTWGGLRGALGMVLALIVSYTPEIPEDIRHQTLFFTAGIVTLTLTINATTMRWLLTRLGLVHTSSARQQLEYRIHHSLYKESEAYYHSLQNLNALQGSNWKKVHTYLIDDEAEPESHPKEPAMVTELRLRVLDREKSTCNALYNDGIISESAFRRLMNSLDELYDHDGSYPLDERNSIFHFCEQVNVLHHMRGFPIIQHWISYYFKERITVIYDLGRGFILLQRTNLDLLDEISQSGLVSEKQTAVFYILRKEIHHNIQRMEEFLEQLATDFPRAYRHALTLKAIRMVLSHEKITVQNMADNSILTEKEAESLIQNITDRADEVNSFSHTIPASILRWMFFFHKRKEWL